MNITAENLSIPRLNTIFLGVAFFWSVVIAALASWNYWQSYASAIEVARSSANQSYSKDLAYRSWAAAHGGVYAPITPETPPNPYLSDIPERDIKTPSGKNLTLINPAYMTRQVHELGKKDFGMIGHITSLKPIRPENVPDEWEKRALQAFQRGEKEVSSVEPLGGDPYLRFMRPLITETGCLTCHATQGYKVGDIRGGISVSLPWAPFREALRSQLLVMILGYGGIWTIGILGLYLGRKRIENHLTERKQAGDVLHEQEIKLLSIFRAAPVGIGMVINRVFQEANDTLCQMTGYSREELLGRDARMLYPTQEDYDYVGREKYRQIDEKSTGSVETRWKRKDGAVIDIILSSSPLDPDSLGKGVTFTALDITARRQAEEEKRLLEERLQHADKMEAIGTLAGGIAHDFNNLLMGIQGYASLALINLDSSDPNYEKLKRIEEHVQSGADLTRQLLGFARGGRYDVKPADMNDILEKSSSMFGRAKKEISIHRKYGKDLRPVEVDRGQMEQVFMNLYVNAWQAMPGGGEIYLETEDVLLDDEQATPYAVKPGEYVKITVTDTGTGMDEKTRVRIFDPFFTTKAMGRGTGLGLATVYGIVKGHKGMIHVDSEPGHGTTFTIYLPVSEKEVVKEKTATGAIAKGTEAILLVDDEKTVLEVSRELLEFLGYRIYPVGSGQEAIAVYMEKQKEIDLVVLDMIMPGISGGETFDRLREINPAAKVLLSSGYSINGEAKTIMDRGCNGFIQKPFQLEKLSRKIREMLG